MVSARSSKALLGGFGNQRSMNILVVKFHDIVTIITNQKIAFMSFIGMGRNPGRRSLIPPCESNPPPIKNPMHDTQ